MSDPGMPQPDAMRSWTSRYEGGTRPEATGREQTVRQDPVAFERPALDVGFDGSRRWITVRGELDFAHCAILADVMTMLIKRDPGNATVDIHEVQFSDTPSMNLFVAFCNELGRHGATMIVVGSTPPVRRAFHAAGLGALLASD